MNQNISDDDDFQEPLRTKKEPLQTEEEPLRTEEDQETADSEYDFIPEEYVFPPIDPMDKYHELDQIIYILKNWAKKNHFGLIKAKSQQNKVYFVCTYSSYKKITPNEAAKRQKTSYKTDCPFILRITYKKQGDYWSLNEPKDLTEHTHNHPCTESYNSITPHGKKQLTTQKDLELIANMSMNNSKIPEILKNISNYEGNPVLNYQDVANIRSEIMQDDSKINSKIDDARVFLNTMKAKGYSIRYQSTENVDGAYVKLKSVFFVNASMVKNARKLGQAFAIDATYKTNNAEMRLICVHGVHNLGADKLVNFPAAFAFTTNETESTYKWFLEQFNEVVVSSSEEISPVFVTDKCTALMNGLDYVFPDSPKLLCTWHMMQNIKSEFKFCFTNEKIKMECTSLVLKMINTKDEDHYNKYLEEFNAKCLDPDNINDYAPIVESENFENPINKNKAYDYFNKNWVPIKNKWAGHITKNFAHFGCLTTQRAESAHNALKNGMSKRMDLITSFEHMDKYWVKLDLKFKQLEKQESQKVDIYMMNNKMLDLIRKKVSRAALIAAHAACLTVSSENYVQKGCFDEENLPCSCAARVNNKLPCIHTVLSLKGKPFEIEHIDRRWHLNTASIDVQPTDSTSVRTVENEEDAAVKPSWYSLLTKLELKFRQCENDSNQLSYLEDLVKKAIKDSDVMAEDYTKDNSLPELILMPTTNDVKKVGRPSKEICHRPTWKKFKDPKKSRAEQMAAKVTDGKVKIA